MLLTLFSTMHNNTESQKYSHGIAEKVGSGRGGINLVGLVMGSVTSGIPQ